MKRDLTTKWKIAALEYQAALHQVVDKEHRKTGKYSQDRSLLIDRKILQEARQTVHKWFTCKSKVCNFVLGNAVGPCNFVLGNAVRSFLL